MGFRLSFLALWAVLLCGQATAPVRDGDSIRFALAREGCFGACPVYSVEIRGNGQVTYQGRASVAVAGERSGRVTRQELGQLVAEFRRADYMSLKEEYGQLAFDIETVSFSASIDGSTKSVADRRFKAESTPAVVAQLEDAIDRIAHTAQWVRK